MAKKEKPSKVRAQGETKKKQEKVDETQVEEQQLEEDQLEGVTGGATKLWEPPPD